MYCLYLEAFEALTVTRIPIIVHFKLKHIHLSYMLTYNLYIYIYIYIKYL